MKRRDFMVLLGGVLAGPVGAHAQNRALPVIGFLNSGSARAFQRQMDAFRQGLKETGYVEGQNLTIDYRWAEGEPTRLPELAAALVRRGVSLIAATGGSVSARAAANATSTIPIVFIAGPDPVADGLVQSLNRPGGNATGVAMMTSRLMAKRVELLLELVPSATTIALLLHEAGVGADAVETDVEAALRGLGRQMVLLKVGAETDDLEATFISAVRQRADALIVTSNASFTNRRAEIVALAARHGLPAAYAWREFPEAGGLMSYGPRFAWAYHQTGQYAGRVLKGEKPADLPVQQPVKVETVINLKTARALGLTVPYLTLIRADEAIE
jgi:putative ABC transport system substrate-binding protein